MPPARSLGILVGASLALKLAIVFAVLSVECAGDQCSFLWAARSVLAGEGFTYGTPDWDDGHTPPLYVLFLAGALALGGDSLTGVRVAQALLSILTILATYRVTVRLASARAALLAAGLVGFLPELVAYFQFAFAENLFAPLLLVLVLAALRTTRSRRPRDAVLLGVALGLCALTRSMMLYFAPFLAAWLLVTMRGETGKALVLAGITFAATLATISPWTAYNHARFDRFLLLATNAGNVFHRNLNFTAPENYDYRSQRLTHWAPEREPRARCTEENPVDRYRCEVAGAVRFVLENPARTLRYAWIKWRGLWNPSSFFVKYLAGGVYGEVGAGAMRVAVVLFAGSAIAVAILAALGFAGARGPHPGWSLLLTIVLYWHVIYGLAFGMSRYRVPLLPILLVAAAAFLADPATAMRQLRARRTSWLLVPVGAVLVASWSLYGPVLGELFG